MIGLDTNILARYYIEDATDAESLRQREIARRIIGSGKKLMICKTVILELEWVMRGYYRFQPDQVVAVLHHLLSLPQVTVEDRESVEQALVHYTDGFDFADILHHSSYRVCAAAVHWYAQQQISQGKAAEIAGLCRAEFIDELFKRKIPACQVTIEELMEEIKDDDE